VQTPICTSLHKMMQYTLSNATMYTEGSVRTTFLNKVIIGIKQKYKWICATQAKKKILWEVEIPWPRPKMNLRLIAFSKYESEVDGLLLLAFFFLFTSWRYDLPDIHQTIWHVSKLITNSLTQVVTQILLCIISISYVHLICDEPPWCYHTV